MIEAAKEEAARRGTSLSRLVADLFRSLTVAGSPSPGNGSSSDITEAAPRPLGSRTRRLLGVLREADADTDAHKKHLEEKHLS